MYIQGTRIDDKHNIGVTTSLYSKQTSEVSSLLAVQNVVEAYKRKKHPMYKYVHAPNVQLVLHVDSTGAPSSPKRGSPLGLTSSC